jgi:hypothetical protein
MKIPASFFSQQNLSWPANAGHPEGRRAQFIIECVWRSSSFVRSPGMREPVRELSLYDRLGGPLLRAMTSVGRGKAFQVRFC